MLRIETVINRPRDFKIFRDGIRDGDRVKGWFPMAKRISQLYRYAEISLAANRRYLDALSAQDDPGSAEEDMRRLSGRVVRKGRSHAGFNPACREHVALFEAVMRGEHSIAGFRNEDIRRRLFNCEKTQDKARSLSGRTGRLLKRLQSHGLISKVQRSRRWRVTPGGARLMGKAIAIYHGSYQHSCGRKAA